MLKELSFILLGSISEQVVTTNYMKSFIINQNAYKEKLQNSIKN